MFEQGVEHVNKCSAVRAVQTISLVRRRLSRTPGRGHDRNRFDQRVEFNSGRHRFVPHLRRVWKHPHLSTAALIARSCAVR